MNDRGCQRRWPAWAAGIYALAAISLGWAGCGQSGLPPDGGACNPGPPIDAGPPPTDAPPFGCWARISSSLGERIDLNGGDCFFKGAFAAGFWNAGGGNGVANYPGPPGFDAHLERIDHAGTYRSCDFATGAAPFILVFLPSGTYNFDLDQHELAQVNLVVATDTHGTLDAILPDRYPNRDAGGTPSATAMLHVDF